jgi:superfamily II DNA/RNA helicase
MARKGGDITTFGHVNAFATRYGRLVPSGLISGCVASVPNAGLGSAPSLIQSECWGWALSPSPPDLVAISPTGSGKTLAFLLPAFADLVTAQSDESHTSVAATAGMSDEDIKAAADAAMRGAATEAFRLAIAGGATSEVAKAQARTAGQEAWKAFKRAAQVTRAPATTTDQSSLGGAAGREGSGVLAAPAVLILAPTRELCSQTADTAALITRAAGLGVNTACIVGGADFVRQRAELLANLPHLIVATPGRLLSLCGVLPASSRARLLAATVDAERTRGITGTQPPGASTDEMVGPPACRLGSVRLLVLDEADRLLEMGFEEDVHNLVRLTRERSPAKAAAAAAAAAGAPAATGRAAASAEPPQSDSPPWTMMFSATWTPKISQLAFSVLAPGAVHLTVGGTALAAASTVEQRLEVLRDREKGAPRMRKLMGLLCEYLEGIDGAPVTAPAAGALGSQSGEEGEDGEDGDESEGEESEGEEHEGEDGDEAEAERDGTGAEGAAAGAAAVGPERDEHVAAGPLIILFCVYKKEVKDVGKLLSAHGFACTLLHGDMSQTARAASLGAFRAGQQRVLVATDVAARGLDVPNVSHVINLSAGLSVDAYVHRVGRCGRAGRSGVSHTFVLESDAALAGPLAQLLERTRQPVPPQLMELAQQHARAEAVATKRVQAKLAKGAVDDDDEEEDERRQQQIANRERQMMAQQAKVKREKAQQQAKKGGHGKGRK